jgi:dTMP kinase
MKTKKGFFIVLEGGEGSGKTTLIKKVSKYFCDSVVITREPGGSPYAEEIRNLVLNSRNAEQANALTYFLMFVAGRADHMKNTIVPALKAGKIVVCDRFDASTYAYQMVAQGAKELKPLFWEMRKYLYNKYKYEPNLYVYLDVNPEVGLCRKTRQEEQKNHFDERCINFHRDLRLGFKEFFANRHQPVKKVIINAENSEEEVFKDFVKLLPPI